MKNESQKQWAISQLKTYGSVSRNEALKNYISRLGAIMNDLLKEGWHWRGEYVKTAYGKDYQYILVKLPPKKEAPKLW